MNDIRVSENFKLREFQCKGANCCGGTVKLDSELLNRLQKMRGRVGGQLVVNSGYRCPAHNQSIPKAAAESQHLFGKAVDFRIPSISMEEQVKLAEEFFGDGGIGYAGNYTHVDTGSARTWQEAK